MGTCFNRVLAVTPGFSAGFEDARSRCPGLRDRLSIPKSDTDCGAADASREYSWRSDKPAIGSYLFDLIDRLNRNDSTELLDELFECRAESIGSMLVTFGIVQL
jgi:hypothetical protein